MVAVKYTDHLTLRLKVRKIPKEYPKIIHSAPEQVFYDTIEGALIATKKLHYNGKERRMMIAYTEDKGIASIITIHPITEEKIINRIMRKRWIAHG